MTETPVPVVPEADGNSETSANAQYKYDCVINNWTEQEYRDICASVPNICKKYIIGKEVGEGGTPHLQIYISLKKKMRIKALHSIKGLERASMRKCRNENALIDYCKKDGDFISGGFPKPIKIISDLRPWQTKIEGIYLGPVDDRKINWFWEPMGNIGKSAFVKYLVVKYGALFCDGGKKSDLINLVFNSNMESCKAVIWDLPRCSEGNISYSTLETVKNGIVCNTKYETGVKCFNSPHIFVFANFPPENLSKLSKDRWNVVRLFNIVYDLEEYFRR